MFNFSSNELRTGIDRWQMIHEGCAHIIHWRITQNSNMQSISMQPFNQNFQWKSSQNFPGFVRRETFLKALSVTDRLDLQHHISRYTSSSCDDKHVCFICKNKTHKKIIHKYNCVETTIKAEEQRRRRQRRRDNHGGIITFYEIVNNHLHESSVSLWVRMSRRMMKMSFMCNMSLTIACRCSSSACRSTSMIPYRRRLRRWAGATDCSSSTR